MKPEQTKAGFAAIIGAPNAGKSTLVNALVGEKVTIVTHKIQTTRFQIRGIAMEDNRQIVLVDTPGIFDPKQRLDRSMVHAAWSGVKDADAIVHVVDAAAYHKVLSGDQPSAQDKNATKDIERVEHGLRKRAGQKPVFLALNKIDLMKVEELLPLIEKANKSGLYEEIFPLSAEKNEGVLPLKRALAEAMPAGPLLYPADLAADIPSRLLAAEITREKLFLRLHNELPYASFVETEKWTNQKNGAVRIEQIIYVKRGSQKSIVLGKNGQTIKAIGQAARKGMSETFGRPVHLFLFVKVRENWSEDRSKYLESGLEFDA